MGDLRSHFTYAIYPMHTKWNKDAFEMNDKPEKTKLNFDL